MFWLIAVLCDLVLIAAYVGYKVYLGTINCFGQGLREHWMIIPIALLLDLFFWLVLVWPNLIIRRNVPKMLEAERESRYPPLRLT